MLRLFAFLFCLPLAVLAQDGKPIRFMVAFTPGGTADTLARLIAQKLGELRGMQAIVENRGGANGTIGLDAFRAWPADGTGYSFVSNSQVGYIDRTFSGCTLSVACVSDVLTIAGVTVRGTCEYNGGISAMILRVIGADRIGYSYVTNGTEARRGQFEGDGNVIPTASAGTEAGATGTIVVRTPARIITLSFDARSWSPSPGTGSCAVFATALAV